MKRSDESTGDEGSITFSRRSPELTLELRAKRKAWDAHVDVDDKYITLQYLSNEACVASRNFTHVKSKWQISEIGEACDWRKKLMQTAKKEFFGRKIPLIAAIPESCRCQSE